MRGRVGALIAALALASVAHAQQKPKNVILFIGDGMGPAHVTAIRLLRGEQFQIGRMRHIGLVATSAADAAVTDSAAAASAYATGVKARYEAVSVDADGVAQETVLERAEKVGKSTGLVTTAEFWDATPAAFAAHAKHRNEAHDIVAQILRSGVDLIVGGGLQRLGTDGNPSLDQLAKMGGYTPARNRAELEAAKGPKILAVFPVEPRDTDFPDAPLPMLTRWALDRLSGDPEGFFLLVESEGIDSTSHRNFDVELRPALASFDEAVGVGLDFAAGRGDTLVLVTGDHETGGMRISETRQRRRWRIEFSTVEHTAVMVPIFAFGPGAESFTGIMENTEVGRRLLALQTGK